MCVVLKVLGERETPVDSIRRRRITCFAHVTKGMRRIYRRRLIIIIGAWREHGVEEDKNDTDGKRETRSRGKDKDTEEEMHLVNTSS